MTRGGRGSAAAAAAASGASSGSVTIERGAAVLQDVGGLGRGEAEVDRDGDRPDGVGGQRRLEEFRPVRHQDRDPVAPADPAPANAAAGPALGRAAAPR